MITKKQFKALSPHDRGFAVYMCGHRKEEPNVPAEACPYPEGSVAHKRYTRGQNEAMIICTDMEE